jgi:hypothetical protein
MKVMGNLDDLNSKAQERFELLKLKKWGKNFQVVKESSRRNEVKIDEDKFSKMLSAPVEHTIKGELVANDDVDREATIVTSSLEFIDSLKLPPNLSIAIGYIIASKNKDRVDNLQNAIEFIKQEI